MADRGCVLRRLDRIRALHPEAADELVRMHADSWNATDAATLELCRLRVRALLGGPPALEEWPTSPALTEAGRAHIAFAEQFVISVSDITEHDVDTLLAHTDADGAYGFIAALYVIDMTERLDMVTSAVLQPQRVPA